LENGMTNADPEVVPAAIDWLNYEIAAMKKAIEG